MKTQCPHCQAKYKAPDGSTGKKVKCPKCNQSFAIVPLTDAPIHPQPRGTYKAKAQSKVCENCGQTINTTEHTYNHEGKVVCATCFDLLQTSLEADSLKKRRRRTICASLIITLAGLLLWSGYAVISALNVRFKAQAICLGKPSQKMIICPATKRIAIVQNKGGKEQIIIEGIDGKEYDEIKGPYMPSVMDFPDEQMERRAVFEFSPDGSRFAYKARREDQEFLVIDEKEFAVEGGISQFEFSPNGKRYAYVQTMDDRKNYLVVDGVKQPGNGDYNFYGLTFSPDSTKLAYVTLLKQESENRREETTTKKYRAYVNGLVVGESTHPIMRLVFSPDSKKVAYLVREGSTFRVWLDGLASEKYHNVFWLRFIPATGKLAYVAARSGNVFLVVDGVKGSGYDSMSPPILSPDGRRVAFAGKRGQNFMAVIDGAEGDNFDNIEGLAFSPDSKRLIYEAVRNNYHYVVLDGAAGKEYDDIKLLTFSPDSMHVAYAAMRGEKWFLVSDETKQEEEYDDIGSLFFSSDNKHVAFSANVGKGKTTFDILKEDEYELEEVERITGEDSFGIPKFEKQTMKVPNEKGMKRLDKAGGKWLIVVDGKKQKGYNRVSNLTFVPSDERVVYWAEKNDKWVIVIGRKEYGKFEDLVNCTKGIRRYIKGELVPDCPFVFDSTKNFCSLAEKDDKIFRIEIELQAD